MEDVRQNSKLQKELKDLNSQQGASLYALIVVMTLLGILILAGLKIAPAYMDDQVISNALQNLKESGELSKMSLRDVRTYVTRTAQTNGGSFASDGIDQVEEGGIDYLVVDYESRVPMFSNIDAVVKFNYRIEK
ncbi:MAG: DUF4845 domain-containing protein [Gammaproteobacteria bacterium]|jgi:hypothetical protein|nr:DUF4845 domain-containing protein [Gammaproteobacteria bacterium]MBT6044103.1 DUF4845 domain-containing protein [Gammaproteobacteria bacterium]